MYRIKLFLINIITAGTFCIGLSGCSIFNKKAEGHSVPEIQNLLNQAMRGNKEANSLLKNLIDSTFTRPVGFEQIQIDSIVSESNKYFTVVLVHKNPFYNRFALYNNDLNLLLIDKSLNGSVELKPYFKDKKITIEARDFFVSKDSAHISRLSIYSQIRNSVALVFRNYVKLIMPDDVYKQEIAFSSKDSISTIISSAKEGEIARDVFIFDNIANRYISSNNTFEKLLLTEVSNLIVQPQNPQLMYDLSKRTDEIDDPSYFFQINHFLINVEKGWLLFRNYNASGNLKKPLTGFKYINDSLSASIFIAPLAMSDKAENYVNGKLGNKSKGKYTVLFSEPVEDNISIVRYFEYSCSNRKFLLMIQVNKSIFKTSKKYFEDIINSFVIDC